MQSLTIWGHSKISPWIKVLASSSLHCSPYSNFNPVSFIFVWSLYVGWDLCVLLCVEWLLAVQKGIQYFAHREQCGSIALVKLVGDLTVDHPASADIRRFLQEIIKIFFQHMCYPHQHREGHFCLCNLNMADRVVGTAHQPGQLRLCQIFLHTSQLDSLADPCIIDCILQLHHPLLLMKSL